MYILRRLSSAARKWLRWVTSPKSINTRIPGCKLEAKFNPGPGIVLVQQPSVDTIANIQYDGNDHIFLGLKIGRVYSVRHGDDLTAHFWRCRGSVRTCTNGSGLLNSIDNAKAAGRPHSPIFLVFCLPKRIPCDSIGLALNIRDAALA